MAVILQSGETRQIDVALLPVISVIFVPPPWLEIRVTEYPIPQTVPLDTNLRALVRVKNQTDYPASATVDVSFVDPELATRRVGMRSYDLSLDPDQEMTVTSSRIIVDKVGIWPIRATIGGPGVVPAVEEWEAVHVV